MDIDPSIAADSNGVCLRPFQPGDLPAAHALSSALGWPHRIEDWQFALSLGHGVTAECDGKVLGTAIAWQWGADYATLGLVIVSTELQGRRIGNRMMQALLNHLGSRSVLLHATKAGRSLYERLGFVATGEVAQHQGLLANLPAVAGREDDRLRPLEEGDDIGALIALDACGAGMIRGELLRRVFAQEEIVILERGGKVAGFAALRRFGRGQTIGPVAAPDANAARLLIGDCLRRTHGFVRVDVDITSDLSPWLESLGLTCVGGGVVMVRGRVPQRGPAHGNWALFTQAMG